MDEIRMDSILGIVILFLLLALLALFLIYGTNPCHKCKFEIEGNSLDIKEFFQVFFNKCLIGRDGSQIKSLDINLSGLNISS